MNEVDETMTFIMAGCMIDICLHMAAAQDSGRKEAAHKRVASTIEKALKVLQRDPDFIVRFGRMQKTVMEEFERRKTAEI